MQLMRLFKTVNSIQLTGVNMETGTYTLRPEYQVPAVKANYDFLTSGHWGNPCTAIAGGGGKTLMMADVNRLLIQNHDARILNITHSWKLIQQNRAKFIKHLPQYKDIVGVNCAGLHMRDYDHQVIFASIQSTFDKAKALTKSGNIQIVQVDECFPSGTLIDGKPIETIKVNDLVTAWDENTKGFFKKKVTYCFKNKVPSTLVRITAGNNELVSTINHPILTDRGWVSGGNLNFTDKIAIEVDNAKENILGRDHIDMLCMQERVQTEISSSIQKLEKQEEGVLLNGVQLDFQKSPFLQNDGKNQQEICICENEKEQSDEESRNSTTGIRNIEKNEMETTYSGGKRETANSATKEISTHIGMGNRSGCSDKPEESEQRKIPITLQNRYCQRRVKSWDRSGWEQPQCIKEESTGPKEGRILKWIRVDNIEVHQRGSSEEYEEMCPDGYVYNIEVEDLHTYVANGIVVHNCHHIPFHETAQYQELFHSLRKINPKMKFVSWSGSPYRTGEGYIYKPDMPDHFINHLIWETGIKEMIDWGYATPLVNVPGKHIPDFSTVTISNGEYDQIEVEAIVTNPKLVRAYVDEIIKYANGGFDNVIRHKNAVYCAGKDHADAIYTELLKRDEKATVIHYEVDQIEGDGEVKRRLKAFDESEYRHIVNANMLIEGWDCPLLDMLSDCGATKSLIRYIQRAFRLTRVEPIMCWCGTENTQIGSDCQTCGSPIERNKKNSLYLDCVGNIGEHGSIDLAKPGPATDLLAKEEQPKRVCKSCGEKVKYSFHVCPYCNADLPRKEVNRKAKTKVQSETKIISEPIWHDVTGVNYKVFAGDLVVNYKSRSGMPFEKRSFGPNAIHDTQSWIKERLSEDRPLPKSAAEFMTGGFNHLLKTPSKVKADKIGANFNILEYEF